MVRLALFLHIYQPPTQDPSILEDIVQASYFPLIELLEAYSTASITLNIPASLTIQLADDYPELVETVKNLVSKGQIELTGSAAYHPLLFNTPKKEIYRQIRLNEEINKEIWGNCWQPCGFFPPELAVDQQVLEVVEDCGYNWALLEDAYSRQISCKGGVAKREGGDLKVVFRNKSLSLKIAFAKITTVDNLLATLHENPPQISVNPPQIRENPILCLDGETFGWHQPSQLNLLEQLFALSSESEMKNGNLRLYTVTEIIEDFPPGLEVKIGKSSWGKRMEEGEQIYYPRWEDPNNEIHQMQWELTDLAIEAVRNSQFKILSDKLNENLKIENSAQKQWLKARHLLDKALHSDQYFWAEGKHVWHLGMVEKGVKMLRDVVVTVPDANEKTKQEARSLYQEIVDLGVDLHGEGIVEEGGVEFGT